MNVLRSGWCALVLLGGVTGHCADPGPAEVVRAVTSKLRLPAGTMPLAIRMIEADGPRRWELMFEDGNFKGNRRVVEYQDNIVTDDRADTIAGVSSGSLTPLVHGDLADRTAEVRQRAGTLAAMAEMECHGVRALLLRPAADGSAHWEIEILDRSKQVVGRVIFGCPQPRLIASSWGGDAKIVGPAHRGIEALGMESVKALQELEDRLRRLLQGDGEKEQ